MQYDPSSLDEIHLLPPFLHYENIELCKAKIVQWFETSDVTCEMNSKTRAIAKKKLFQAFFCAP